MRVARPFRPRAVFLPTLYLDVRCAKVVSHQLDTEAKDVYVVFFWRTPHLTLPVRPRETATKEIPRAAPQLAFLDRDAQGAQKVYILGVESFVCL